MKKKIQVRKWGNSCGVRLSKDVLYALNIKENDDLIVEVDIESKTITLKPDIERFSFDITQEPKCLLTLPLFKKQ